MSVTTAIPVIRKTSGITEGTINRLYDANGIAQPTNRHYINRPTVWSHVDRSSSTISLEEIKNNMSYSSIVKDMTQCSADVIVEDIQLTPYITVRYTYIIE